MEQSALIEKKGETQSMAPEETPKSNPVEKVETPKATAKNELSKCKVASKVNESIRNFKNALVDLWILVTPLLLNCRIVKPFFEDAITLVEYIARKLDAFSVKYETIKDVKFLAIIELIQSFASELLEFVNSDASERIVMKYLVHSHMLILESLDYAAKGLEYAVPIVPGVKPLMELDCAERSIRKKCFCLIMNFFYRMIQRMSVHAEGLCGFINKYISLPVFACNKKEVSVEAVKE